MEYLSKKEFNLRFLWELQRYPPKVARDLFHECRNDIWFRGLRYAQRRWARFIYLPKLADIPETSTERKLKRSKFKGDALTRELPVCDYGDGSVAWTNCLPCPLYKDGECMSKGGIARRAAHGNRQEEEADGVVKTETGKPPDEMILELPQIPIKIWLERHRKRGVTLQGSDGLAIDWLWCLSAWDKLGRPIIYAAPGDPLYDLSLCLYPEKLSPWRLQGIADWLKEHSVETKGKRI